MIIALFIALCICFCIWYTSHQKLLLFVAHTLGNCLQQKTVVLVEIIFVDLVSFSVHRSLQKCSFKTLQCVRIDNDLRFVGVSSFITESLEEQKTLLFIDFVGIWIKRRLQIRNLISESSFVFIYMQPSSKISSIFLFYHLGIDCEKQPISNKSRRKRRS